MGACLLQNQSQTFETTSESRRNICTFCLAEMKKKPQRQEGPNDCKMFPTMSENESIGHQYSNFYHPYQYYVTTPPIGESSSESQESVFTVAS